MEPKKVLQITLAAALFTGISALADKPQNKGGKYQYEYEHDYEKEDRYKKEEKYKKQEKYEKHKKYEEKKQKPVPYGLEKKTQKGEPLPPGWQKKIQKGEVMDEDMLKRARIIHSKEYPKTPGSEIYQIENKIFRVMKATREILEVLKD